MLSRPGLTAIAAVLALSSTSAIAQVALPDVGAPSVAQSAPMAAPVPTVQSVPTAPALPDIAVSEAPTPARPTAQAAPRQRTAPVEAVARTAPSVARASASPAASVPARVQPEVAPANAPADPARTALATPAPEASMRQQATAGPSRAEANAANDTDYAGWALLGGGLLIVVGGAAFAMSRRPRRRDEARETAAYTVPVAPIMPEAVDNRPAPLVTAPIVGEEARRPVVAAQSRAVLPDRNAGEVSGEDRHALLEAMIAEAPSEANPFHSRRNRLRRADFLLRTGQASAVGPQQRTSQEQAMTSDRWSEMRFGRKSAPRVSWKPATNR